VRAVPHAGAFGMVAVPGSDHREWRWSPGRHTTGNVFAQTLAGDSPLSSTRLASCLLDIASQLPGD